MNEFAKRDSGVGLFILLVIGVFFIFLPLFLVFFYTLLQIVPTLAAVASSDINNKSTVQLQTLYDESENSTPAPRFSPARVGMWPFLSQVMSLRTRFRVLALYRGLPIFIPIWFMEMIIAITSFNFLSPGFALVPQVILPLILAQWYTVWTHTVLITPSSRPWKSRIPPFIPTVCATGFPLSIFLFGKALQKAVFMTVWKNTQSVDMDPRRVAILIFVPMLVELAVLAPARVVLARVQVSMLSDHEKPVIGIDEALYHHGAKVGGSYTIGALKAWSSFTRRSWLRYIIVYSQVLLAVIFGGGAVVFFGLVFYISIAMMGWRF